MYRFYYPQVNRQFLNNYRAFNRQNMTSRQGDGFDIGEDAPDFTLSGIINGKPNEVTLSDLKGKWVVLFFYGSDFTFV